MDKPMRTKSAVILAVAFLTAVACVPAVTGDAAETDSGYVSQLDANGKQIYSEVVSAVTSALEDPSNTLTVTDKPGRLVLFEAKEDALDYIEDIVKKALYATYYSMPMAAWLWNLPVAEPELAPTTDLVKVTSENDPSDVRTYWRISEAVITMTVPDSIADNPDTEANELADALKKVRDAVKSYSGDDASMVKAMADDLRSITSKDDGEGEVSNLYDALVERKSSSAGIAAAFAYTAQSNSLEALVAHGIVGTGSDSGYWNLVRLDGSWYGADVTVYDGKDRAPLLAGSATEIGSGSSYERFGSTHVADEEPLGQISIVRDGYSWPDDRSFFEKWGSQIIIVAIVALILATIVYALKKDVI